MKKAYKKPGVAIADRENGKMISNSPELEERLKMYCSQMLQKENGEYVQTEKKD